MDAKVKARLEAAGWKDGDYGDFLGLTAEERELVETRLKLARTIRELRERAGMTQGQLATKLKTTQPRVVKIERAAKDVSMDVLVRGYFAVGGRILMRLPGRVKSKGKTRRTKVRA